MEGNVGRADRARADEQWHRLHDELSARVAAVLVDPASHLPDMPFVANAGLVHDGTFVPARVRYAREPESPARSRRCCTPSASAT